MYKRQLLGRALKTPVALVRLAVRVAFGVLKLAVKLVLFGVFLPLRLLASHLNALDLERYPDLGTDNNLCIPLGATVDGEEAPVGLACSKRLAHMWEVVKWPWALRSGHLRGNQIFTARSC